MEDWKSDTELCFAHLSLQRPCMHFEFLTYMESFFSVSFMQTALRITLTFVGCPLRALNGTG